MPEEPVSCSCCKQESICSMNHHLVMAIWSMPAFQLQMSEKDLISNMQPIMAANCPYYEIAEKDLP